jgi:hypothetical protein
MVFTTKKEWPLFDLVHGNPQTFQGTTDGAARPCIVMESKRCFVQLYTEHRDLKSSGINDHALCPAYLGDKLPNTKTANAAAGKDQAAIA